MRGINTGSVASRILKNMIKTLDIRSSIKKIDRISRVERVCQVLIVDL